MESLQPVNLVFMTQQEVEVYFYELCTILQFFKKWKYFLKEK